MYTLGKALQYLINDDSLNKKARKPRDAAAVGYGLKFADITSLTVAELRKPGFKAIDVPFRREIEFNVISTFTYLWIGGTATWD